MTARDVIAGVLAEHGIGWIDNGSPDLARCYCGHRPKLGESWYRHVADALIAAGVTVPEPISAQLAGEPMSDDLRERIARVSIRQRCCSDCHPTHIDYDLADDLIRELGIREEWLVDDIETYDTSEQAAERKTELLNDYGDDPPAEGVPVRYRYVTDWRPADDQP